MSLKRCLEDVKSASPRALVNLLEGRYKGETLMMLAARGGHHQVGSTLLRYGSNPSLGFDPTIEQDETDEVQESTHDKATPSTPIFLASRAGHANFVALLLRNGVSNEDCLTSFLYEVDLRVASVVFAESKVSLIRVRDILHAWLAEPDGCARAERLLFASRRLDEDLATPQSMVVAAYHLNAPAVRLLHDYGIRADKDVDEGLRYNYDYSLGDLNREKRPLDAAIKRIDEITRDEVLRLSMTMHELIAAGDEVKPKHLEQLLRLNDPEPFSMAISWCKKIETDVISQAIRYNRLSAVALALSARLPSSRELDILLTEAQRRSLPSIYNLLSAAKRYQELSEERYAVPRAITSLMQMVNLAIAGFARTAPGQDRTFLLPRPELADMLEAAKERYETLLHRALAHSQNDVATLSLAPPSFRSRSALPRVIRQPND